MALIDNPISSIVNLANTVLDRVLPDKQANDAAKANLAQMALKGEFDQMMGQIQINIAEAQSKSTFVAGWRPAVGWCCAGALAYSYILQPCIVSIVLMCGVKLDVSQLPHLNMTELIGLLTTMLGMGVMRTIDKSQGTDNGH